MTVCALSRTIRRYNVRKGFNNGSLHIYRHTFAKHWILNGGDLSAYKNIRSFKYAYCKGVCRNVFNDLQKTYSDYNHLIG